MPRRQGLTLRGLKTLELRVQRHAENAGRIASALASHTAVTRVYYPGLPNHPVHQVAKQQMTGSAACCRSNSTARPSAC